MKLLLKVTRRLAWLKAIKKAKTWMFFPPPKVLLSLSSYIHMFLCLNRLWTYNYLYWEWTRNSVHTLSSNPAVANIKKKKEIGDIFWIHHHTMTRQSPLWEYIVYRRNNTKMTFRILYNNNIIISHFIVVSERVTRRNLQIVTFFTTISVCYECVRLCWWQKVSFITLCESSSWYISNKLKWCILSAKLA